MSSLNDILGPIYPRVTIIFNMYNMYIYVESISQSHMTLHNRGNIIFQSHNDNLYIRYLHLCGVRFSITYDIAQYKYIHNKLRFPFLAVLVVAATFLFCWLGLRPSLPDRITTRPLSLEVTALLFSRCLVFRNFVRCRFLTIDFSLIVSLRSTIITSS